LELVGDERDKLGICRLALRVRDGVAEKALEPFVERVKNLLGDRVKEVRLTHRLTDTPAIVTTDADEMSTQMAKLFAAAGQAAPEVKYVLATCGYRTFVMALMTSMSCTAIMIASRRY
jgi:HSP90 family molecular chaperone